METSAQVKAPPAEPMRCPRCYGIRLTWGHCGLVCLTCGYCMGSEEGHARDMADEAH